MQKVDRAHDADALADPQGRPRRLHVRGRPARGGRRAGARPGQRVLGVARRCRSTSTSSCSPASCKGSPVELVPGEDDRHRGSRERRDRARGLRRAGRRGARGAVRRPHRLLHGGRAVPRVPRDGDHDAPRRDLSVDRRRQAAAGGRVARQGDRADLPAGDPDERARARRLRPAGRRRVPQLLHRLDPEAVPGPRAEGDARDLGARACCR